MYNALQIVAKRILQYPKIGVKHAHVREGIICINDNC